MVALWKQLIRSNATRGSNTTKTDAAAAITEHISRNLSYKGLAGALLPFREFLGKYREGLSLYRWDQRTVSVVRKAISTVFVVGGIEPEEAVAMWKTDIQQLCFAPSVPLSASSPSRHDEALRFYFAISDYSHFITEIFSMLSCADAMEQAVRRANCHQAYK